MKRYSIFGYYGQGNAGDEAILSALIEGIKTYIPSSSIGVYSANPVETKKSHGVDAYNFFSTSLKAVIKGLLRRSRINYVKAVSNFFKTDVVIIGGGGLFFDTKETNKWIFGYLNLIHQAKKHNKKVALVGISVGPLHHKGSEEAIADAFSKADLISVRDESSRDLLIKCGVPATKINVIPDLVFSLTSADAGKIDAIFHNENIPTDQANNISLTPCCYNTNQKGWLENYCAFIEKTINEFSANIWLIPMQRGADHDDLKAIESIYAALSPASQKKTFILKGYYSAREIQGLLSRSDFVFAERLHGSIMALNTNTQFMSLAYMPKVTGVLTQAGLSVRAVNMQSFLNGDSLDAQLQDMTKYLAQPHENAISNAEIKQRALDNFKQLSLL